MQESAKVKFDLIHKSYKYDQNKKQWKEIEVIWEDKTQKKIQSFKCLTYNVWFENHNFQERGIELMKIVELHSPDFICYQEVTQDFLNTVKQNKFIQENYYISANPISGYGVIILQKQRPLYFFEQRFPSNMGRTLLGSVNNGGIIISTSHLESLANADLRKQQLQISFDVLKNYDEIVMMGDFNFDNPIEDAQLQNGNYQDVWKMLKPNDYGKTQKKTNRFPAWRPDRVIIKSKSYKADDIQIVGDYPIPFYETHQVKYDDEIKTPSDHLGLITNFIL